MFAFCGNGRRLLVAAAMSCVSLAVWGAAANAEEAKKIDGRELFTREWIPGDARSHGGDGLGPVFNDTSCVGCHNQGGVGGAGPKAKNAQIVTAFSNRAVNQGFEPASTSLFGAIITMFGGPRTASPRPPATEDEADRIAKERDDLAKIHPGFRTARSVVLHRASTESEYAAFRGKLNGMANFEGMVGNIAMEGRIVPAGESGPPLSVEQQSEINRLKAEAQFGGQQAFNGGAGNFTFLVSERNTIPLFGSGKIDVIPDNVLIAAAEQRFDDFPEVSGRVAKLKNGFIGRFGWKGQKARLSEFVLTACAVELGLNVPGEPQSGMPQRPEYVPQGLDLTQRECNALIAFVASLPAPQERATAHRTEAEYLDSGRKLFASVGCAACHTEKLGDVEGIYSDLLLHDMGQELSDSGNYAGFAPNATEEEELKGPVPPLAAAAAEPVDESKLIGATRQEWRTPPLWGLRDSAPYLHDGRADTIEQAIAKHGGEATRSVRQFIRLSADERLQLTLFLRSLQAPIP
ncbi:MAG TPA: di-heme oxidoredictase family protein [Pirellulaceae bacterium]|nr:di-heme oxidoredictase family protein [Pirellulaceae bacterium]